MCNSFYNLKITFKLINNEKTKCLNSTIVLESAHMNQKNLNKYDRA